MNVINDKWLYVRYLDNRVEQVSIRQAFIDAEKIKNIETPTFHGVKAFIYDVPVIQLLTTILLAVYFKPETDFLARDEDFQAILLEDGKYDLSLILNYLDKWQDRFNLFDERYPFLQDTRLKPYADFTNDNIEAYLPKISLLAPSANNIVFEKCVSDHRLSFDDYKPNMTELVYMLLYNQSMGTSPMAKQYPNKTLLTNASMFVVNYKDNLKNTILANALPLRKSHTGELYDRPVWELDDRMDALTKFDVGTVFENVLLCTFFPCLPIYIAYDNEVKDIKLAQVGVCDDCILDKKLKESITQGYVIYNPLTIKSESKDKKTDETTYSYTTWNKSTRLIRLCIDVTKQTAIGELCPVLSLGSDANTIIYYREYDENKCNVLSFGKYELSQNVFAELTKPENHKKAIQFQNIISMVKDSFNIFREAMNDMTVTTVNGKQIKHSTTIDNTITTFNSFAENYFFSDFVGNIADDKVMTTTYETLCSKAKEIVYKLGNVTKNPIKFADMMSLFYYKLKKIQEVVNEQ